MTLEVLFTAEINDGQGPLNNPVRVIVETDSWDKAAKWAADEVAESMRVDRLPADCPRQTLRVQCIREAGCRAIFLP